LCRVSRINAVRFRVSLRDGGVSVRVVRWTLRQGGCTLNVWLKMPTNRGIRGTHSVSQSQSVMVHYGQLLPLLPLLAASMRG